MKKQTVPWAITSLRVVALPFLLYSFNKQIQAATYALFLFVICTDFVDGYVAKKLEATSRLGSYFDVAADFLFVSGMFLAFILSIVDSSSHNYCFCTIRVNKFILETGSL